MLGIAGQRLAVRTSQCKEPPRALECWGGSFAAELALRSMFSDALCPPRIRETLTVSREAFRRPKKLTNRLPRTASELAIAQSLGLAKSEPPPALHAGGSLRSVTGGWRGHLPSQEVGQAPADESEGTSGRRLAYAG